MSFKACSGLGARSVPRNRWLGLSLPYALSMLLEFGNENIQAVSFSDLINQQVQLFLCVVWSRLFASSS